MQETICDIPQCGLPASPNIILTGAKGPTGLPLSNGTISTLSYDLCLGHWVSLSPVISPFLTGKIAATVILP